MSWSVDPWATHCSASAGCAWAWHEKTVGHGESQRVGWEGESAERLP